MLPLLALVLACTPGPADPDRIAAAPVLAFGGDLQLGRRTNAIVGQRGPAYPFAKLPQLREADLAIVNLEAVLAGVGHPGRDKGEAGPFYFRARPELAAVLQEAGVDAVATANNHSGDYGPAAVLDQAERLTAAGIAFAGTGPDREAACAPTFVRAGDLTVALLSVDATMPPFAVGEQPGGCFLDIDDAPAWQAELGPRVAAARERAHLVFLAVHWGPNNKTRPSAAVKAAARAAIAADVDAVLGSSAHRVQGVELIDGRPVIYDAGNLLFDSHQTGEGQHGALFRLALDPAGVLQVRVLPVHVDYGFTEPETGEVGEAALARMRERIEALDTRVRQEAGELVVDLPAPSARPAPTGPAPEPRAAVAPERLATPPDACVVDSVPDDVRVDPQAFGPLTLLGRRVSPTALTGRRLVNVETWWRIDAPLSDDYWLYERIVAEDGDRDKMWWGDHEPCDWMWPTSRWEPGRIYRDHALLRPPSKLPPGAYAAIVGALAPGQKLVSKPQALGYLRVSGAAPAKAD